VFGALTDYLWKPTYKWACWSHANKPKHWIVGRYFGKFNKFRNDRWVFGDRETGAYLPKPAWTDIVRHTLVQSGASPDDPSAARSNRTHLVHATCHRSKHQPRTARNTVMQQTNRTALAACLGRVPALRYNDATDSVECFMSINVRYELHG
jgi:hypothetical protein